MRYNSEEEIYNLGWISHRSMMRSSSPPLSYGIYWDHTVMGNIAGLKGHTTGGYVALRGRPSIAGSLHKFVVHWSSVAGPFTRFVPST